MKKVLAISGSIRRNSSNGAILHAMADAYKGILDIQVLEDLDLLPHFHPDQTGEKLPPAVQNFHELIRQADGLLICTPEYVFSIPAILKNALEWMVATTLLSGKPTAMIVASASGKVAFDSLTLILQTLEADMNDRSCLLIQGAKGKVDKAGRISDDDTGRRVRELMEELISVMERKKGKS